MNIQISGNLSGPTAIFLAGWPDTCDVFRDNIMAALAADYRIVGITLPGFDDDHPFLQMMREKGLRNSFGDSSFSESGAGKQSSSAELGGSWLPNIFPFSLFHNRDAEAQAAAVQRSSLVNTLRISCGQPPFEMFQTTWKGHSFQDLVTMLEIAVDTAMETCNYCPSTIPSVAAASAPTAGRRQTRPAQTASPVDRRGSGRGDEVSHSEDGLEGIPLHQLPPTYTRPVLIAHDWGCFLAYELLLVRPGFFSRFVALDIGAYVFESKAEHVERMCGLVSHNEKGSTSATPRFGASPPRTPGVALSANTEQTHLLSRGAGNAATSSFSTREPEGYGESSFLARARQPHEAQRTTSAASGAGAERKSSTSFTETSSPLQPKQHPKTQSGSSPRESRPSSPVTVVHGVSPGTHKGRADTNNASTLRFDGLNSPVPNTSQLRSSVAGAATKRSLASQYAIRRKKPTKQTQRADTWKGILILLYQSFLILCDVVFPHRLARWLVGCFASLIGRPTYCYDPQIVSTPTVELLNHTLNAQFFAQHPYALENRGAFDLPVLLQVQDGASSVGRVDASSFPSINLEHPSLMRGTPPSRLLPGWKFMLIPYVEGSAVPSDRTRQAHNAAGLEQHDSMALQTPPPSRRNTRCRAHGTDSAAGATGHTYSSRSWRSSSPNFSQTSTDWSQDEDTSPLHPTNRQQDATWRNKSHTAPTAAGSGVSAASDAGYTIYSSYAKGASLFEEWNAPMEGFGRVNANAGTSGELDPYLSVLAIPNPLWVAEDPLALTGAQSFQDPQRGGASVNDGYDLVAPDGDAPLRGSATAASSSSMQVIKRKIYYQAIAFPPLKPLANASSSSLAGDSGTTATSPVHNGDDGMSSRSTHSTVLGRLRRSQRKAALRPSVPVLASPMQGWIYLRFWLGLLLLCFMAFVSWLLGEKKSTAASGAGDAAGSGGGGSTVSGGGSAGKAYSNVMTTAMTTIYRRLPATPSLASSTANLPGDGDVVLQPMSYAPLVSQRFFVPLSLPILFLYGGEKSVMFHADHWCAYIRQYQRPRDGISDVVEVQGGGHWFFAEKKYQKKVADRIAEFLAAEQRSPLGL